VHQLQRSFAASEVTLMLYTPQELQQRMHSAVRDCSFEHLGSWITFPFAVIGAEF
jgi:hypothetical protein